MRSLTQFLSGFATNRGENPQDHSHQYFSSSNPEATALREQLASESLESLITWLKDGGNVGIHGAHVAC
jgi:hypothetical protein